MPKSKKKKSTRLSAKKLAELEQININVAGIDIGDGEMYVSVPESRDEQSVRIFATFTHDLHQLSQWLQKCEVESVVMESTGIYWIPIHQILEESGLEVLLVNAAHAKNIPGRKTDVLDCQWLRQLHTYGLLRGSFIPPAPIRAIRTLIRHREMLIQHRASHIQHIQKTLQQMNLKLTQVLTDITGTTGMAIIRDIVRGEHRPEILAQNRNFRCHSSEEDIAKSLEGHYLPEHLFTLAQAVALFDFYSQQIEVTSQEIERAFAQFAKQENRTSSSLPSPRGRLNHIDKKNEPLRQQLFHIAGIDLTQIDGIRAMTVQTIISEIGVDMSKWKTVKHFTSWLGLSPYNDKTGGKITKTKSRKTRNRVHNALKHAARSVNRSSSALGVFYRRMRAKFGPQIAISATAHKMARVIYHLLKYQTPYIPPDPSIEDERYRQRQLRILQKRAHSIGATLVFEAS